ncbi:hypothetical protein C1H46_014319, partial [Malus baccata]
RWLAWAMLIVVVLVARANAIDIFLEWHVTLDTTRKPVTQDQPVVAINGLFPGLSTPQRMILFTNGIQQRLNSWQDGVSGTNCPIQPGTNWTCVFQTKDQIGSFFYSPSINFHKAAGGFGPIYVINRNVMAVPFPRPEAAFDLLIGDWFYDSSRDDLQVENIKCGECFEFQSGFKTIKWCWLKQKDLALIRLLWILYVHVGQSYSVLVTANQNAADYYMVASPKLVNTSEFTSLVGIGLLHYSNSVSQVSGPLPDGPGPFDLDFSVDQAKSIRWNLTARAARPNPQGTFNVSNVTLSQTLILQGSVADINGEPRYVVNNVSYRTPETPLKLADYYVNGTGVYQLDAFPVHHVNDDAAYGVSVVTGIHKGLIEIVFMNNLDAIDSWNLDGLGTEIGQRIHATHTNLYDPDVRSTVHVYPGGWTAVYAFPDNPGMWNLRSQLLKHCTDSPSTFFSSATPCISNCSKQIEHTERTKRTGAGERERERGDERGDTVAGDGVEWLRKKPSARRTGKGMSRGESFGGG